MARFDWTAFVLGLAAGAGVAAWGIKNAAAHTTSPTAVGDWRTLSARRWTKSRILPPQRRRSRWPLSNGGYSSTPGFP
jgi:hypothetical protein